MLKKAEKPENAQPAAKRKLTRAERKQIGAIIRQAKGDGKPHTVQDSIPFRNLYPDGLCRLDDRLFSKTIAYEDVNYRLAGPDDQRDIFERLCDFYNGYDPSIGVQMTLSSRHEDKNGNLFGMDAQGDALDDMRVEASGILQVCHADHRGGKSSGGAGKVFPDRGRHPEPLQGHGRGRKGAGRQRAAGAAAWPSPSGGRTIRL